MPFCAGVRNFMQIKPSGAELWRHIDFSRWRQRQLQRKRGLIRRVISAHICKCVVLFLSLKNTRQHVKKRLPLWSLCGVHSEEGDGPKILASPIGLQLAPLFVRYNTWAENAPSRMPDRLHGTHCHLTFVLQPALPCSRNYSKCTFKHSIFHLLVFSPLISMTL